MYHLPSQLARWCPTALPRPQPPPSGSSHYLCVCICMLSVMVSPGWFSKLMIGALGGRLMYRFSKLLKSLTLQLISLPPPPPFQKSEGRVQRGCNDAVSLVGKNWEVGADNDETRILRRFYKPSPVPYTTQLAVPALCHAPFSCHHLTGILEAG